MLNKGGSNWSKVELNPLEPPGYGPGDQSETSNMLNTYWRHKRHSSLKFWEWKIVDLLRHSV